MSLPLPLEPGIVLDGHYVVGQLINRGGFGAVYRGIDTSEGDRACAIKETYDVTPSARRQALTEAGILFTVRSKHLPQVYDAFGADGRFYLVMQLIEGQNLLQLLKTSAQPCSEQEVITWLLPIMDVLQELHSRTPAIMHRDIKPSNIILTPDQTAVLVDFGLTRLYDPSSTTQTMVRAVSEGFSPLEQYVGKTSPQSDIYSLAATMYYLLTMRVPPLSLNRSMREELIAPRLLNPALSPHVERVLLKALAVDPVDRYQGMRAFVQALQQPAFTGHADPTIVASSAPANTQAAHSRAGSGVPYTPANSSSHTQRSAPVSAPPPPPPAYPSPAHSLSMPYGPAVPPGYVLVPQSALVPPLPLPSAFGQGCLWGLLQGVLSALMILILKKEAYFYVAIVVGFLFYLLAGYRTTHRGGSFWRGGWAGFWSGITSTVMFWIVFGIGLLILVSLRLSADTQIAQRRGTILPPNELNRAFGSVAPILSSHPAAQSTGSVVVIFLVAGLLLAIGFGLLGGLLGKTEHEEAVKQKRGP